jgi:enterochelin esterase-like enzyme
MPSAKPRAGLTAPGRRTLILRRCIVVALIVVSTSMPARAHLQRFNFDLQRVNRRIKGQVLDYTDNHGHDRRLYSPALGEKRDLYVYLPPCYDPAKQYPLVIWLHGFAQDESTFLKDVVKPLDQAIGSGCLPPCIVAAPDGSLHGVRSYLTAGSFFINTKAGRFEDYLICDVWNFLVQNFPIRPEAEAHVLVGASMGGGAAFNKALKYPERFKVAVGIFPPVNIRWLDCHCRYMSNFDPCCWGWRTDFTRRWETIGRFYLVVKVPLGRVVNPLYGRRNPNTAALVSQENPIELLDYRDIKEGQVDLYIAYGGKDQFNIDARVESFLYRAREKSLTVGVGYDPNGKHDMTTALKLLPGILEWLAPRLAPYAPMP